jgi:uncharacterized delta-60 repeat protein
MCLNSEKLMSTKFTTTFLSCCVGAALLSAGLTASAKSGDLDSHFGVDGIATYTPEFLGISQTEPIAIDQTNRIVFGAREPYGDVVGALNADGTIDTTFGVGGFVVIDEFLCDLKVDSKNRIVVLESDGEGPFTAIRVARYLSDGSVDGKFGTSGFTVASSAIEDLVPSAIALDANDNVFVVGTEPSDPVTGDSHMLVAKIDDTGSLDLGFAGSGLVELALMPVGTEASFGKAVTLDDHAHVIAAGYSRLPTGTIVTDVISLSSDGALDPAFGGSGFVQTEALSGAPDPHFTYVTSMTTDAKGNVVVVGGAGDWSTFSSLLIVRYLPDGSFDPSFGTGSPLLLSAGLDKQNQASSVLIDARDKIVTTGFTAIGDGSDPQLVAFRLSDAGVADLQFGDGTGFKLLNGSLEGGTSAITHGGDIVVLGDDLTSLIWSELIGYDLPPVSPPDHF